MQTNNRLINISKLCYFVNNVSLVKFIDKIKTSVLEVTKYKSQITIWQYFFVSEV